VKNNIKKNQDYKQFKEREKKEQEEMMQEKSETMASVRKMKELYEDNAAKLGVFKIILQIN
jgi:hypothetical protein